MDCGSESNRAASFLFCAILCAIWREGSRCAQIGMDPELTRRRCSARCFALMLFGTCRLDCRQCRNSVYLSQKLGEQRWK